MREIGLLELFVIVIETAESPRSRAAVTVTCDTTTPFFAGLVAKAGVAKARARASPHEATAENCMASDFLTSEYYQS